MKKSLFLLLMLLLNSPLLLKGQNAPNRSGNSQLPQESIFLHYNTSLLFSGDYLYYRVYALDPENDLSSGLSKIAYVELLGENGNSIFKHKISLKDGLGQGDFFVSTTVPSGNYKLLGYTSWMKNGGKKNFFRGDIAVINPYSGDQRALRPEESSVSVSSEEPSGSDNNFRTTEPSGVTDRHLQLIFPNGKNFGKREAVTVLISDTDNSEESGNYSVSVRKLDNVELPEKLSTREYHQLYEQTVPAPTQNSLILPELRGDLIKGRISARAPGTDLPLRNKKIALSIPGEDFVFKVAATDEEGRFYINLDGEYSGSTAFFHVLEEKDQAYEITLEEDPAIDHSLLDFQKFQLSPAMEEMILQRSVHNQIENAYYGVKPDTIQGSVQRDPFYAKEPIVYDLDDYTRFKTIRETFTEIIKSAWISRNSQREPVVKVRSLDGATDFRLPALLLIDGAMVEDHQEFIDYPSVKIQSIGILRENFYVGPHIFQGIVDVKTVEGDYAALHGHDYTRQVEWQKPLPEKSYFRQRYTDENREETNRIPDFRYQLLWLPDLDLNEDEVAIEFFTSDVTGVFEVSVEGFTENGEPVSVREIFRVE